jgi:soluble lytic murein transglycosylase-like protein
MRPLVVAGAGLLILGALAMQADDTAPETDGFPAEGGTGDAMGLPPSVARWSDEIAAASARSGVPANIIGAVMAVESGGNPTARAKTTSARGLMQMTKAACETVGADWSQMDLPGPATDAGAAYLAWAHAQVGGEWGDAVRAYYAGATTIRKGTNAALLADADSYLAKVSRYA